MIHGPESFTPDGIFILGQRRARTHVGAGFNAFGIASGGGAGWVLADWVARDRRRWLWVVDIRRFSVARTGPGHRARLKPGKHYTIGFPRNINRAARIVSPLYDP
jgi:4-methylaminobutanoate oxidase (formaldehyde-forming)